MQIIKTCENLSKNKHKVTLIKPGTGNKKVSIKKYYNLKEKINIKEFSSINSFPQGLNFIYTVFFLFIFYFKKKRTFNNYQKLFCLFSIIII